MNGTTQIPIKPEIQTFLENLMTEAGFIDVLPELRSEIFSDLVKAFNQHMLMTVVEKLTPEQLLVFNALTDANCSQEEVEYFLLNTIPNAQTVFAEAVIEFRDIYLQK